MGNRGCCAPRPSDFVEEAGLERGSQKGKFAIVTGANSGIGTTTTEELAALGYIVIMGGRSMVKLKAAADGIRQKQGDAELVLLELDLASLRSVRNFAAEVKKTCNSLSLLINNAGIMAPPYSLSSDGIEMQFATNHVGHYLLTELLLDVLKRGAPSRIVCVSSAAHAMHNIKDVKDINCAAGAYDPWSQYGNTKMCNILHAIELADRLKDDRVTAYALHPGVINSSLARSNGCAGVFYGCCGCCMMDISQGSSQTIQVAVTPGFEKYNGKFFASFKVEAPKAKGHDLNKLARALKEETERLIRDAEQGDRGKEPQEEKDN